MSALFRDVLISCVSASAIPLLLIHIHTERESLLLIPSWLWRSLQHAKAQYLQPCRQVEAEDRKDAEQVRLMVDEARVRNFKSFVRFAIVVLACMVSLVLVCSEGIRGQSVNAWCVLVYATGVLVAFSDVQVTPFRMTVITTLVNFVVLARTCSIQDPACWFLFSGHRLLVRIMLGMLDLDHRKTTIWNVLFFFGNSIKNMMMTTSFPALQLPFWSMSLSEGCACLFVWMTSYIAQRWITDCVRAAFEASASRIDKTMTDHLLSAFCDVQVKLGPNLEILGSHDKLKHILLVGSAGHEFPHGTSFLDYVASADKARFKAFIQASSVPVEVGASASSEELHERPKMFPSALHVHLHDSLGHYLPASIFHSAAKIADGESHHFIGICVDSSEQFTQAQEVSTDCVETQQDRMDFVEQANQNCHADQDCHSKVPSKRKSDSLSSRSSSASSRSKRSQQLLNMDLIDSLSIMFDPFQWSIRKICWNLSDDGHELPNLANQLVQPNPLEFRRWVQDRVSEMLFAESDSSAQERQSSAYGSMTLTLPQLLNSKSHIVISAKSAWLDLQELDEVDDYESASVSLHLKGVQQISNRSRDRQNAVMSTICE